MFTTKTQTYQCSIGSRSAASADSYDSTDTFVSDLTDAKNSRCIGGSGDSLSVGLRTSTRALRFDRRAQRDDADEDDAPGVAVPRSGYTTPSGTGASSYRRGLPDALDR